MKKITKIGIYVLVAGATTAAASLAHGSFNNLKKVFATTTEKQTPQVNVTIAAALKDFSSLSAYEGFLNEIGQTYEDDTVIVSTGDGWAGFPVGDESNDPVTDSRTGKVLTIYSRNDPRGATFAQIKQALKVRDVAFAKGTWRATAQNNRTIAACLAEYKNLADFDRMVADKGFSDGTVLLKPGINGAELPDYISGSSEQKVYDSLNRYVGTYQASTDANSATVAQIRAAYS